MRPLRIGIAVPPPRVHPVGQVASGNGLIFIKDRPFAAAKAIDFRDMGDLGQTCQRIFVASVLLKRWFGWNAGHVCCSERLVVLS